MNEAKIILTEDGSHSIFLPNLKETYHSFHGAIRESMYVYITQGLHYILSQPAKPTALSILEVGFGTGLNIFLAVAELEELKIQASLTTIEPYPLPSAIIENLNYSEILSASNPHLFKTGDFNSLHLAAWEENVKIGNFVSLHKKRKKIQDIEWAGENFELVFFDAFAPSKQPEMWHPEIFLKIFKAMKKGGILVTYCAQGKFKRDLKAIGFEVEILPGPPGKKEMVRAKKPGHQ